MRTLKPTLQQHMPSQTLKHQLARRICKTMGGTRRMYRGYFGLHYLKASQPEIQQRFHVNVNKQVHLLKQEAAKILNLNKVFKTQLAHYAPEHQPLNVVQNDIHHWKTKQNDSLWTQHVTQKGTDGKSIQAMMKWTPYGDAIQRVIQQVAYGESIQRLMHQMPGGEPVMQKIPHGKSLRHLIQKMLYGRSAQDRSHQGSYGESIQRYTAFEWPVYNTYRQFGTPSENNRYLRRLFNRLNQTQSVLQSKRLGYKSYTQWKTAIESSGQFRQVLQQLNRAQNSQGLSAEQYRFYSMQSETVYNPRMLGGILKQLQYFAFRNTQSPFASAPHMLNSDGGTPQIHLRKAHNPTGDHWAAILQRHFEKMPSTHTVQKSNGSTRVDQIIAQLMRHEVNSQSQVENTVLSRWWQRYMGEMNHPKGKRAHSKETVRDTTYRLNARWLKQLAIKTPGMALSFQSPAQNGMGAFERAPLFNMHASYLDEALNENAYWLFRPYWSSVPWNSHLTAEHRSSIEENRYRNWFQKGLTALERTRIYQNASAASRRKQLRQASERFVKEVLYKERQTQNFWVEKRNRSVLLKYLIQKLQGLKLIPGTEAGSPWDRKGTVLKRRQMPQNLRGVKSRPSFNSSPVQYIQRNTALFKKLTIENRLEQEIHQFNQRVHKETTARVKELVQQFVQGNQVQINEGLYKHFKAANFVDAQTAAYFSSLTEEEFENYKPLKQLNAHRFMDYINFNESFTYQHPEHLTHLMTRNEERTEKEADLYQSISKSKMLYQLKKIFERNIVRFYTQNFIKPYQNIGLNLNRFHRNMAFGANYKLDYWQALNTQDHPLWSHALSHIQQIDGGNENTAINTLNLLRETPQKNHKMDHLSRNDKGLNNWRTGQTQKNEHHHHSSEYIYKQTHQHRKTINTSATMVYRLDEQQTEAVAEELKTVYDKRLEKFEEQIETLQNNAPAEIHIQRLSETILRKLEQRLRTERQRRGVI